MAENNNCCGNGPHMNGEVRVMPLGDKGKPHGNLILCSRCWQKELAWRTERNYLLPTDFKFDLPKWADAEVYSNE